MNKTIENMELALNKIVEAFDKREYSELEMLVNTYDILVKQAYDSEACGEFHKQTLRNQAQLFEKIEEESRDVINWLLDKNKFKSANHMAKLAYKFQICKEYLNKIYCKSTTQINTIASEDIQEYGKMIEAIGAVTQESGKIINNALKSIERRIKTDDRVFETLKNSEIDIENKSFEEVMDSIAQKWNGYDIDRQKEIAINVAGRYQMTRFVALMNGLNEE